ERFPRDHAPAPPARDETPQQPAGRAASDDATERFAADPAAPPPTPSPAAPPASPSTSAEERAAGDPGASDGPDRPGRRRHAEGGSPGWRRPAVLAPVGVLAALGLLYGGDLALSSGDVPRGTVVGGVELGGLDPAAARSTLEEQLAPRIAADRPIVADDVEAVFSPTAAGIELDVPATVDVADDQPLNPWTRLVTLFDERTVDPVLTGEDTALTAQLEDIAAQVDRAPVDATIAGEGTDLEVVEPVDGRTLDREGSAEAVTEALAQGRAPDVPVELPVDVEPVDVGLEEARRVLEEVVDPALAAPVTVVSEDGGTSAEIAETAIAASLAFTPQEDGELVVSVDPAALQEALGDELGRFGTPAEDARFEVSDGQVRVVPSVDGTGIDPAQLAEQLLPVLTEPAPRQVTATLGPVPADLTTEEAEALGIREEISSFTTNISNPNSGENIRVVAEEVDGHVVMPGETFSLNDFTGPRGIAQGYVEAGVINNGEFTTAVGGGVSQFATTMFNAVFFAGLEDVFHKPHSYYISRYPAGREATVYYDSIDLEWRNDSDTGVFVDTAWTPGTLTVTFYGTKRYDIESVSSERYNIRQPAVREKPQDGSCRPSNGSTGFDITVTRIFRELGTGNELRRERFQTRYAAEPATRCVEPPPAAPGPPDGAAPPAGG
ncbi:VanW family protein, partial [Geodermatophilus sp. YIM 151500]|uniref:VanW family protein n=1 Tax=Geodermatophilus sp. YIM 151500 TaxID=2984531 RepID=UPI0021E3DF56